MEESIRGMIIRAGLETLLEEIERHEIRIKQVVTWQDRGVYFLLEHHGTPYQIAQQDLPEFVAGCAHEESTSFEVLGKDAAGLQLFAYFHTSCLEQHAATLFRPGWKVIRTISWGEAQEGVYSCDYCDERLIDAPNMTCGCVSKTAYQAECQSGKHLLLRLQSASNRIGGAKEQGWSRTDCARVEQFFLEAEYAYVCHCNSGVYREEDDPERK
jgi:hypothetical protein